MSNISIKDLPASVELDRAAMLAVVGGARRRGPYALAGQPVARLVDYPRGVAAYISPQLGQPSAGGQPRR